MQADPRPWGHQEENRGTFSSTLSFLDHVRPSERFSPLENSLGASEAVAGHCVNDSKGSACMGEILILSGGLKVFIARNRQRLQALQINWGVLHC